MYATCVTVPSTTETHLAIEDLITETPDGLIAHVAGPVEGGWRIIDVWETQEQSERFRAEVLRPAIAQVAGEEALNAPVELFEVTGQAERRGKALASV
jgi:hypothetical protein